MTVMLRSALNLLGSLLIVTVLVLPGPVAANPPQPQPMPNIAVPDELKTCTQNSECGAISVACYFCCDDAINISRRADYKKFTEGQCAYQNGACAFPCPLHNSDFPVCIEGKCQYR